MKTHSQKTFENHHQPVSNALPKFSPSAKSAFQFVDNRPEAKVGRVLQEMADNSNQVKQMKVYQQMADHDRSQNAGHNNILQSMLKSSQSDNTPDNSRSSSLPSPSHYNPVQRIIGGVGTSKEGKSLDFTIDRVAGSVHRFREKHVASSAEDALAKTRARIDLGGNFGRRTPNFCAKEEDWINGINASASVVPPEGEWEKDHGNVSNTFENSLLKASVTGWKIRDASAKDEDPIDLKAVHGATTQSLGGNWSISGLDESGDEVTGNADVDVDIFHVDGH